MAADIAHVSTETKVPLHAFELRDPRDFAEVYSALFDSRKSTPSPEQRQVTLKH